MKNILNNKTFFLISLLFFLIGITASIASSVVWKHGVAIINGKASYIDCSKLDQRSMFLSQNEIDRRIKAGVEKINAGILSWHDENILIVYDKEIKPPHYKITKSKRKYIYKIEKNNMYITDNKKEWDKLEIKIADEYPPQPQGEFTNPVYITIYLKCKYFKGEYEIIGARG